MGYEITFSYHERKEDSGYDTETTKTFTKRFGSQWDDVSIDKVATAVMMQLARRDIWVIDCEIYEYTKKKVTFRETKGGVIIKNKKFSLDGTSCEELEPVEAVERPIMSTPVSAPPPKSNGMATRWEVFDADPNYQVNLTKRGIKMTSGKRYPIMGERTTMARVNIGGVVQEMPSYEYVTTDDNGQQVNLASVHFTPEQRGLIGQELIRRAEHERNGQPKLLYQSGKHDDMPVIRRD